jgi:hypothetical protein
MKAMLCDGMQWYSILAAHLMNSINLKVEGGAGIDFIFSVFPTVLSMQRPY